MTDPVSRAEGNNTQDVMDDLRDLHKQATTENSHFYTAKVITGAMVEIQMLRIAINAMAEADEDSDSAGVQRIANVALRRKYQ